MEKSERAEKPVSISQKYAAAAVDAVVVVVVISSIFFLSNRVFLFSNKCFHNVFCRCFYGRWWPVLLSDRMFGRWF